MGNKQTNETNKKRILMCGVDAAGKTTILYRLKLGEVQTVIPTIGFNVEYVQFKNHEITCWDVAGKDKIHPLWRFYYRNAKALIWVIDSNDRDRIGDSDDYIHDRVTSRSELHDHFLNDALLKDVAILIYANKQDLPNAMSVEEIQNRLGMTQIIKYTPDTFRPIQQNTFLKTLPDTIINIICEYMLTKMCGPNLSGDRIKTSALSQTGMLTFEFLKGPKGDNWSLMRKIQRIICEYVPPYDEGTFGPQIHCKIVGCCATTGDGLYEGLSWLGDILGNETNKKQCTLL